jgi:ribonuclease HI
MRIVREEQVDKNVPWDFFDGESHNNGQACGGGVVLFLSYSNLYKLQMGLGSISNNYVELLALKLLILFAREKGVTSLQIYGDSLNVVNWTKKLQRCHTFLLVPLIEEIERILNSFDSFSIHHVYRE